MPIFSESRALSDKSIGQFLDTAEAINKIRDPELRSDVAGTFDSLIGLWQIFVRQQTLPEAQADSAFSAIASSFAQIRNNRELFDAGRGGVKTLLTASPAGKSTATAAEPQEHIIDLLAGASSSEDAEARDLVTQEIMRILDAQRIVSLDTLFQLADHLESIAKGEKLNNALVAKLSARISEIQLPRASLSAVEKNAMRVRLLDRKTHRSPAPPQPALGRGKGRRRCRKTEGRARASGSSAARHAAGL